MKTKSYYALLSMALISLAFVTSSCEKEETDSKFKLESFSGKWQLNKDSIFATSIETEKVIDTVIIYDDPFKFEITSNGEVKSVNSSVCPKVIIIGDSIKIGCRPNSKIMEISPTEFMLYHRDNGTSYVHDYYSFFKRIN